MTDGTAQPFDPMQHVHEPWARALYAVWTKLDADDRHRLSTLVKRADADKGWDRTAALAAWQAGDRAELDRLLATP